MRCVWLLFPPGYQVIAMENCVCSAALQESYTTLGLSYRLDRQLLKLTEVDLLMTFHHSLYRV